MRDVIFTVNAFSPPAIDRIIEKIDILQTKWTTELVSINTQYVEISKMKGEIESVRRDMVAVLDRWDLHQTLGIEVKKLRVEKKQLIEAIDVLREEHQDLQTDLVTLTADVRALSDRSNDITIELTESEQDLIINKEQLETLETTIAGLKESKIVLKEDVEILGDERRMSEKELLQIQNIQKILKSRWMQPRRAPTIGIIPCYLLT